MSNKSHGFFLTSLSFLTLFLPDLKENGHGALPSTRAVPPAFPQHLTHRCHTNCPRQFSFLVFPGSPSQPARAEARCAPPEATLGTQGGSGGSGGGVLSGQLAVLPAPPFNCKPAEPDGAAKPRGRRSGTFLCRTWWGGAGALLRALLRAGPRGAQPRGVPCAVPARGRRGALGPSAVRGVAPPQRGPGTNPRSCEAARAPEPGVMTEKRGSHTGLGEGK